MPLVPRPNRLQLFAVVSLLLCGEAMAFSALQFDASASRNVSRTGGAVSAWTSTRGGVIASSCHVPGCGWSAPFYGGTLEFGDEPEEFHPTIFHVELRDEDGSETLDRMWVVVNAKIAEKHYNDWCSANSDTSWASALPKPYAKLQISTNWLGRVGATPLNPSNPDPWNSPSKLSGYLHHDSTWEMRSETDADDHGNQACYDGNGDIVCNGIAGGTADYYSGVPRLVRSHIREDVNPYLNALHLDGNPGDTEWNNDISRPCLYQGDYLNQYIERRPIIPPEGE